MAVHSPVVERGTYVTHQPALILSPFLTFQHVAMNVGDHGVGVCDTMANVGNNYVDVQCKLGLRLDG